MNPQPRAPDKMTTASNILESTFGAGLWLIHGAALDKLMVRAAQYAAGERGACSRHVAAPSAAKHFPRAGENWDGAVEMPGMTVDRGVAEIPIYGFIGDKLDPLAKWYFDATDMRDVQREIALAEADSSVQAVAFTFDTPGGSSRNVPETGEMIAAIRKPTVSWVDGMAASAGYWLAANASAAYSTKASDIGSIGVYSVFTDYSKMFEEFGINRQVFASGKYKGMGIPGTSLTDTQKALIQSEVDELAAEFKGVVRSRRGDVPDDVMEGQTVSAVKAVTARLIDGVRQSKEVVFSEMSLR